MTCAVLAINQHKGGTGKSTLARIISEGVALSGRKVLAIDLDMQANLSRRYLNMAPKNGGTDGPVPPMHPEYKSPDAPAGWSGRSSSADIYTTGFVYDYDTKHPNITIIPADHRRLRELTVRGTSSTEASSSIENALSSFIKDSQLDDLFDLIVLDTAPTFSAITLSAIRASTHMLIPVKMEPMSAEGIQETLALWYKENMRRPTDESIKLLGIIPNMYQKNLTLHKEILKTFKANSVMSDLVHDELAIGNRSHFASSDIASVDGDTDQIVINSVFNRKPSDLARLEAERLTNYVIEQIWGDAASELEAQTA